MFDAPAKAAQLAELVLCGGDGSAIAPQCRRVLQGIELRFKSRLRTGYLIQEICADSAIRINGRGPLIAGSRSICRLARYRLLVSRIFQP